MTDTLLWLAAAGLFVGVEAATTSLVSVWFAVGAVAALAVSLFADSLATQLLVFALVSAAALAVMLPRLRASRRNQPPVTNGSPLTIGKQGVVLRPIRPGDLGRVRVDGLDWQARASVALPEGARIRVDDVDGAVLIVSQVAEATV